MSQYNVKVIHYSTSGEAKIYDNTIHVDSSSYIDTHQDVVWFNSHQYKNIFQKVRAKDHRNKLLAIVSISHEGKCIRRRYMCDQQNVPLKNSELGLTSEAVRILFDATTASIKQVTVTKGDLYDIIKYYWDHPFHATRISFKIGLPALILSILSLVLGIFLLIITLNC